MASGGSPRCTLPRARGVLRRAAVAVAVFGVARALIGMEEPRAWATAHRQDINRATPGLRGSLQMAPACDSGAHGLCGGSAAFMAKDVVCMALGPGIALYGVVARAAAQRQRRRRRRDPPGGAAAPRGPPKTLQDDSKTVDGRVVDETVSDIATAFQVTDADRKRRQALRRERMKEEQEEQQEDDAVRNLVEKGEDPDFFGAPYIWIQAAHVVLFTYVVLCCVLGASGQSSALFALDDDALITLKQALSITLVVNFFHAIFVFYEEYTAGEDRFFAAFGWCVKSLILGGIVSWQRIGRIKKAEKKRIQEEKRRQRLAELGVTEF